MIYYIYQHKGKEHNMKDMKITKDTETNGFTLNQTVIMRITAEVRHEDEDGEWYTTETIWRKDTVVPPVDDIDERKAYFTGAYKEAEEQLKRFESEK